MQSTCSPRMPRRTKRHVGVAVIMLLLGTVVVPLVTAPTSAAVEAVVSEACSPGTTSSVEAASVSTESNGHSYTPSSSRNGRYIAFRSSASNLVADDTNGKDDIFVRDRGTAVVSRVSVDSSGIETCFSSYDPSISADGRYVAFHSNSTTLVTGDTNAVTDVFVHDRATATTTRISLSSSGAQANGASYAPSVSADARYVAFESDASNLVTSDTNGVRDVFVRDRSASLTTRASISSSGAQANGASNAPSISGDGRYVAFETSASNFSVFDQNATRDVYLRDRTGNSTVWASAGSNGAANGSSTSPSISANGRYVAFATPSALLSSDTNGVSDIYEFDRTTGVTTRLSFDDLRGGGNGASTFPSLSGDGTTTAFVTASTNLAQDTNARNDIYVHIWGDSERTQCVVAPVSVPNGQPGSPPDPGLDPCEDKEPEGQTHHIATDKNSKSFARGGPWTTAFKELFFDPAGLSIKNEPTNLVAIVGHKGPHPEEYHRIVYDRLKLAISGKTGTAFVDAGKAELVAIGQEAATPGTHLNNLVTKGDPLCP